MIENLNLKDLKFKMNVTKFNKNLLTMSRDYKK